jgi:F0F1-type ATP synthase assembly protein I
MLIGLAVGVFIGAVTDNIPIGAGGGLSIGLAIGFGVDEWVKRQADDGRNKESSED